MRRRRTLAAVALLVLALVAGACGGDGGDSSPPPDGEQPATAPIRIGTKNFTEQYILGELYRQALEAKGFEVDLKLDVGSSEITHRALIGGGLDMYPEYVGTLLTEIARVERLPADSDAAYALARRYVEGLGFELLEPTPFSDANALAVKPRFARRHRLRTIADLRRLKGKVVVGALPEFATRIEGLVGLRDVYGLRNLVVASRLDSAGRYPALESGKVQVASVFTTEGQLAGDDYVLLEDPRHLFAVQHAAPIIDRDVVRRHGSGLTDAIDAVSRVLTTDAMRRMNGEVDLEHRTARDVASEFLKQKGLL